ncbi:MAG: hypothetical protein QM731_09535 [Chitinophagaceae bacterium]
MSNSKTKAGTNIALRLMTFALCMGTFISSCKKTEVVPYEAEQANTITEFKVTNATEVLYGVVDNVDNTITVYVPYYLSISYIIPQIKLEDGAKLIDKDGNEIDIREDLEPVAFDSVGYTYSVKDTKNNIRKYTLVTTIVPYKDPLTLGFATKRDANGNTVADDTVTYEALVNASVYVYGNFESSSKNGKLTLISQKTKTAVPNALTILNVTRGTEIHYMQMLISASVDSGYYNIIVEHQGRKDTLPTIHLIYKKPMFDFLGSTYAVGETVTLGIRGSGTPGNNSGVNTGIARMYVKLIKQHFVALPANFPDSLFDKQIEVEIVSQSRTQVQFKFPDLPVGAYSTSMSSGGGIDGYSIQYTGFGFYFDFNSTGWGKDNLLTAISYTLDLTAKK